MQVPGLKDLDLSQLINLNWLEIKDCPQLTTLNLKTGSNLLIPFPNLRVSEENDLLECIQVDDEDWYRTEYPYYLTRNITFSEDCDY